MDLPALLGGPMVRPQGPPAWPPSDAEVLLALQTAFHSGVWGRYHGGLCERLVEALKAYHQLDHVLLCGSGTYAVELGLRALGVGPGDEVIQPAYDYDGNFYSIHATGATPVLVDVDPANWNMALSALPEAVGPQTKAILVSHLHGGFVPMRALMEFARSRGLRVLEDAAQCPGAIIDGKTAGTWGDAGVLSFGGSKLLSAGRGGALLTPHTDIAQRARTILQRGNNLICPLAELQAAVLLPQLEKLDERNQRRQASVELLHAALTGVPGLKPFANPAGGHQPGYYKVGFQFDSEQFGLDRARFIAAVRAEGIALDEGYAALHVGRSPRRFRQGSALTEAGRADRGLVMLHHPVLLEGEHALRQITEAISKAQHHRLLFGNG